MDPVQMQLMQQVAQGQIPGIPGTQAPLTIGGQHGGAANLSAMSDPRLSPYVRPIAENTMPDLSPLAPIQPMLNKFGVVGAVAGLAGNAALTGMMTEAGVMPTGNAGSAMQAYRTRAHQEMQRDVGQQVAGQDAEGIYRTIRGGYAIMGVPFNSEQRKAAEGVANKIAEYGPMLAMAAPEFLDSISGERGSVQAMAGQMMQANRYRIDPETGQMGYGTEANADLVNKTFENMFAGDNVAKMQGMRAGDVGQMYRRLAPEGLVGPKESLRDRTLMELNAARDKGTLKDIGKEADVNVDGNLAALSHADLSKLQATSSIKEGLSDSDARKISSQLQSYVKTLSAMREVFGENGNPNAPIPQLINALEALTSGQMHKFDSSRLNAIVRDMQSLSQMSGKSIDQIAAMNQQAAGQGQQLGIGTTFASTATNIGVTTGMAFQERGGAVGFGALSREGAEQASMNLFNRGMASEMSNSLGALGRIEEAGGFADNEHGQRLEAVMAAARAGESTYIDPETKKERALPTQEAHFRSLITAGGVEGMNGSDFNMMLGDRTSNLRMLHSDPELQQAAFNSQSREVIKLVERQVSNRLSTAKPLMDEEGMSSGDRNAAARSMGSAATSALSALSPSEVQDPEVRNRAIADALIAEAGNQGITLSDQEALTMSTGVFGQAEKGVKRFGHESWTAFAQVQGEGVTEARMERSSQVKARAGVNDAMSGLGPQGSIMQRLSTAMQKQGDRGGEANLSTMLQDMFGVDIEQAREKLMPELQAVVDEKAAISELEGELNGASPARRRELNRQIKTRTADLKAKVQETRKIGKTLGVGGGADVFDLEDVAVSRKAARNLENYGRIDQVRLLAADGKVTPSQLEAVQDEAITDQDLRALGAAARGEALEAADKSAAGEVEDMAPEAKERYDKLIADGIADKDARQRVRQGLREGVDTSETYAEGFQEEYRGFDVGRLGEEAQKTIVRKRRSTKTLAPTEDEIDDLVEELDEDAKRPDVGTLPTRAERTTIQKEIKQLEAELEVGPEQRAAIEKKIEARKAELAGIDPKQQAAMTQDIAKLEAELAGPTAVQRAAIEKKIEARKAELAGETTPEQSVLTEEITRLKAELSETTEADQRAELEGTIEALEADLSQSVSPRQSKLAEEITELKSELGPTEERRDVIKAEIDTRQVALTGLTSEQLESRDQDIAKLEAELEGPDKARRAEIETEINTRKARLAGVDPEQQEARAREIASLSAELEGPTVKRQVAIQGEIDTRQAALAEATPAQKEKLTEEIASLSAELEGPTVKRQVAIQEEIKALETSTGRTPKQQEAVRQGIVELEEELAGPTAARRDAIESELEGHRSGAFAATEKKETLSREIVGLEAELSGPDGDRHAEIDEEIEVLEVGISAATTSKRREELTQEIAVLNAEKEGPTVEQQADIKAGIASRKVELGKVEEQQESRVAAEKGVEDEVARRFGFESYESFEKASGEELTPEQRKNIKNKISLKKATLAKPNREDREDADHDRTLMSEEHLLAQNQLRASGQLGEDQTLRGDVDDFKDMDIELRNQLQDTKMEDRAGIVSKYIDSKVKEKFYGTGDTPEDRKISRGKARVDATEQLGTAEGRRSLKEAGEDLATMSDTRREFLMDEDAAVRLGSAVTLEAVTKSRDAEQDLQILANKYYGGSPKKLLASAGLAMSAKGADDSEKEFLALEDKQKKELAARMSKSTGVEVTAAEVNLGMYREDIYNQSKAHVKDMTDANEVLFGGANQTEMAERLGVSQDQLTTLQEITAIETADVSETAKKLGMTEEKYQAIVKGEKKLDPGLRLFKGEDADDQLKSAIADEKSLSYNQVSLDTKKAKIAKDAERGIHSAESAKSVEQQEAQMAEARGRQNKAMKAAGLNYKQPEDRRRYRQLLKVQGEVTRLSKKTEDYASKRQGLIDSGKSEEEIDKTLGTMKAEELEAREVLKKFREQDLGKTGDALAEGFGITADGESESESELAEFKKTIEGGGESQGRNLKMVAGVLDQVKDLKIEGVAEDATAIQKLDALTDDWKDADTLKKKEELANSHGMTGEELGRAMEHTEFMKMGLVGKDKDYAKSGQFAKSLDEVGSKDIAAQVKAEEERQMKITGTVNITGVVTGEGTFEDVNGRTVR